MAAIVWGDVTTFAPELSTVDIGIQTDLLAFANARVAPLNHDGETGITTKLARIYLAAHMASRLPTTGGGAAGPIASESEGGLSVSYAVSAPGPSDSDLALTAYGRAFAALGRGSRSRASVLL